MATRRSAGIVLYRLRASAIEVLLAHPGGPLFASKDRGHWTIPKGEPDGDPDLLRVARREFEEETGHPAPDGPPIELGTIQQKGGKIVHGWALEGDLDPATAASMTFELDWPPHSGRRITVPEIDRVAWFAPDEARHRIKSAQIPFLDRLEAALALDQPT